MKSCEAYQEMISMMLDGELSADEKAEVEAHIADCPECAAMYAAFSDLGKIEIEEVPDTLHAEIMRGVAVAAKAKRTQGKLLYLRRVMTAAACLVVVVGTLFALKNSLLPRRNATTAAVAGDTELMYAASAERNKAAEAPAEAAVAEVPAAAAPAAPEYFGSAENSYFTEDCEDYAANQAIKSETVPAAEPVPEPLPEEGYGAIEDAPGAKALQEIIVEIVSVQDDGFTAVDSSTGETVKVVIHDRIFVSDEVRRSLIPGAVVAVQYDHRDDSGVPTVDAEVIYLPK